MEVKQGKTSRAVSFAIGAIMLTAIGSAMGSLVFIMLSRAAGETQSDVRKFLYRMAVIAVVLFLLVVIVFVRMLCQYVSFRLKGEKRPPTPYVDAWALAGKRYKLTDEEKQIETLEDLDIEPGNSDGSSPGDFPRDDRDNEGGGER
jgi:membrane protein implicated in regulation of membrane protease activity